MKKIAIFIAITIIAICGVYFVYLNYVSNYKIAKKENFEFEKNLNEELTGSELATIINKAIDSNKKNEVEIDNKGIYQNNDKNSINIEIKMTDVKSTFKMEKIYNAGIQNFINHYSDIKFKCKKVEHHYSTNKVKYMLFEQITE